MQLLSKIEITSLNCFAVLHFPKDSHPILRTAEPFSILPLPFFGLSLGWPNTNRLQLFLGRRWIWTAGKARLINFPVILSLFSASVSMLDKKICTKKGRFVQVVGFHQEIPLQATHGGGTKAAEMKWTQPEWREFSTSQDSSSWVNQANPSVWWNLIWYSLGSVYCPLAD